MLQAQRRFLTSEWWEYRLNELRGFTNKDVSNRTDLFWGLHTGQYSGSHIMLGFSAEGSWSGFMNNLPAASMRPGGGAVGVHFVVEYQYSGLLFQTGLGINYQRVFNNISDTCFYHYNMHDTWEGIKDVEFILKHDFYHRQDMAQQVYGQLPLYLGHYILGPTGVGYWLVGFHLNYAFWGNTRQKLEGSTMAQYEAYLGIWREMDNHGYRKDVPIERKGEQLKLKFDVMAHGEIGYEYLPYQPSYKRYTTTQLDVRLRFAGFVDVGILNINPRTDKVFYETPMETIYDFPTYRMDHVFSTKDAKDFWLRNLFVGVRLTVLFGLKPPEKCILCDPWLRYRVNR